MMVGRRDVGTTRRGSQQAGECKSRLVKQGGRLLVVTSTPRVLAVHPSSDLYGSDRMFLSSVEALDDPVVVLPQDGSLVCELKRVGAQVTILRFPVLRKVE